MTKKQKDKLNRELFKLIYDWKKEQPDEFDICEKMTGDESMTQGMVWLLTWLLTSNRVKGVNV